jgi:SAM-dependent methyltransferase
MVTLHVASSNAEQLNEWDGAGGAFWAANPDRFDAGVAAHHGAFIAAAAIEPTDRVLDVGSGSGQASRDAAWTFRRRC